KKQRARATRHHARASRLSIAQAKELRTGKAKGGAPVFADETEMKKSLRQALVKAPYNVHDYYRPDGCAQQVARHAMFENCTLVVIVLNCLWMAIDTDNNPAAVLIDAPPVFQVAEHLFCTYFFIEITIRFLAFEYKCDCFRDFWFVFDFCLSLYMIAETWILSIVLVVADLRETDSLFSANVLRIIRMVKILRLTRMAKLLRSIPELGIVAKAIGAAGRSLLVIAAFCVMVLYVFALLMKQITDMVQEPPADSALTADFATVATSMNTLLLKSMFAESASFVYSLAAWHPVFWPFVVLFILITSVTMMYMLIGVMVNVVNSVAASEREGSTVSLIAQSLRQVMSKLGMDPDGPLSKQTVTDLLLDAEVAQFLYSLDVDSIVMVEMLDTFYEDIMEKEGRQMNFEDLVDGLLNLRGTNPATVQDVKGSIRILKTSFTKELSDLRKSLLGEINTLKIDLRDGGDLESSGSEHDAS
ncbi:CACNA1A, partial [Symbiodinium sp. KB8]